MIYKVFTEDWCGLLCVDAPKVEAIRQALLDDREAAKRAARPRALSDPTRLMLAAALQEGAELCVCDLAWISGRKQALVSPYLRTLRAERLVRSRREGKLVFYALTGEGRALLDAVLGKTTKVRA